MTGGGDHELLTSVSVACALDDSPLPGLLRRLDEPFLGDVMNEDWGEWLLIGVGVFVLGGLFIYLMMLVADFVFYLFIWEGT